MKCYILEQFLSRMLALNRIYAGYPVGALNKLREDPGLDAAFQRLQEREHHLTVEEDSGLFGLRLAHPHLANAIYEAWF